MAMSHPKTVAALRKDHDFCVDLRGAAAGLCADPGREWRSQIAKELSSASVIFTAGDYGIVHENGKESPLAPESIVLDQGWSKEGEFYTPHGLRDLIDRENNTAVDLLVA